MLGLKDWYHAYVLEGEEVSTLKALEDFFFSEHIKTQGNPDYTLHRTELFSIEDSQRLVALSTTSAIGGGKKIIISAFQFITHEAQNALLKLFEEPPAGMHFFIIVPSVSLLLPTVLSRVMRVRALERSVSGTGVLYAKGKEVEVETFLKASKAKRIDLAKEIATNRTQAAQFLDALEQYYAVHKKTKTALEALYRTRTYMRDRGASPKMLLEYVALTLP